MTGHKYPVIELFGPTVQGEGVLTGFPTHFLRFGGCGFKCKWCDSMHAVDPAQVKANRTMMTVEEIARAIEGLPFAPWITLTGGDPALQRELQELITWCWLRNMAVAVETQGELWPEWLNLPDVITFSPKAPSSGMHQSITEFRDKLANFKLRHRPRGRVAIKVVVFDQADLTWAITLKEELHYGINNAIALYDNFIFQVGSPLNSEIPDMEGLRHGMEGAEGIDEMIEGARETWKRNMILTRYNWLVSALTQQYSSVMDRRTSITPQLHTLLWPMEERGR